MNDFEFRRISNARQIKIFYNSNSYSAFPHIIRMDSDEMLLSFRQAPREPILRHTHPRSVITVVRSFDLGQSWEIDSASQLAAGGGQELGLLYLGTGRVGGALAAHEVVLERQLRPHLATR